MAFVGDAVSSMPFAISEDRSSLKELMSALKNSNCNISVESSQATLTPKSGQSNIGARIWGK